MLTPSAVRGLGPDGLAELLRRRPEALEPSPPRSLQELLARLNHPIAVRAAVDRLNLPTVQVAEALAALGEHADRSRLLALLGLPGPAPDDDRVPAVDQAVRTLRDHLLLAPAGPTRSTDPTGPTRSTDGNGRNGRNGAPWRDAVLTPQARALWSTPLGLDPDTETLAAGLTVDDLRSVLGRLDAGPLPSRKAELVRALATVTSDPDRIRGLLDQAPPDLAEHLVDVAHGRRVLHHYSWFSLRHNRSENRRRDPVEWALSLFLLVRQDWDSRLKMPAEVALALRGPGWTAPFTPHRPAAGWIPLAPHVVTRSAAAATTAALQAVTATLTAAGTHPIAQLKSGAVGVRELRRLSTTVGCTTGELRLVLALTHRLRLISSVDEGVVPTRRFDQWQRRSAADRFADLLDAWFQLPALPLADPGSSWAPAASSRPPALRRLVLESLADHPNCAPDTITALVEQVRWQAPRLFTDREADPAGSDHPVATAVSPSAGSPTPGSPTGAEPDTAGRAAALIAVTAVLTEAAWLGVTGADALAPAGRAALTGEDVATAIGDALGAVHRTARLQTDLTAVVLGEPSPELAAALDAMADRENRSTATSWRFSPASVRRAMDAGVDEPTLLARLAALADGPVPQPLDYLVRDVARRHGALRGGRIGCYLRSDDEGLLAELVVDRKLRKLGLRRIAPTVVVGTHPLADTLDALRAAGHSPVEEGPDGATVPTRDHRHRADPHPGRYPAEALLAGLPDLVRGFPDPTRSDPADHLADDPADLDDLDDLDDLEDLEDPGPDDGPGEGDVPRWRGTGDAASRPGNRDRNRIAEVAAALLAGPDRAGGRLIDLGSHVMDSATLFHLHDRP